MKSISQDMKFRYSLMKYSEKFGVARAARRYNKSTSYIYFWKKRFDGSIESLACHSRRPHSHPNQHTEAERMLKQNKIVPVLLILDQLYILAHDFHSITVYSKSPIHSDGSFSTNYCRY